MTPHILVVDDDTRLRELLSKYLKENGYWVTAAADAAEARGKMAGLAFDLLIIDVMMPGESGVELTRSLGASTRVPILMLTAMGEPRDRIAGLESGADDYLVKPFEPRELLLRIGKILRRVQRPAAEGIGLGEYTFDVGRGELSLGGAPVYLTSGEIQLLRIFAESPGVTLSRAELGRLTGGARDRSVDVQITRLRRRIESNPRAPRYLQTVRGEGYVLWPD